MTAMMSEINVGLTKHVRDALNIKTTDRFISYGVGPKARDVLVGLSDSTEEVAGVAIDTVEYEENKDENFCVYRNFHDVKTDKMFDRVFCHYDELPGSLRHLQKILEPCYNLCLSSKGMVLITGIPLESLPKTEHFLVGKHVTRYWFLNKSGGKFDLLYNKDNYCV